MTKVENPIQPLSQPSTTQYQKPKEFLFSEFQNEFETIKAFVEDLRQLPIQITAKEDSHILKYTKTILDFLQHPEALKNEKLYRNSLIGLGNFLGIKYTFLGKQNVSDRFFKNLVDYFSNLCQNQDQKDFNMLAYPVLYIIVLMIYNSDKQNSKKLFERVFVKKFIRALCSVNFKQGNKVQRYLPVMIAFIAKGLSGQESNGLLKELVLKNLHFSNIQKNSFQFIYSLRVLINKEGFSLNEIRKYNLLEHLQKLLQMNIHLQQQVSMVIEVLRHILKRHQILGYKIVTPKFMELLEKSYKICHSQTLGLIEIISPCLPYELKLRMLEIHSQVLMKGQRQTASGVEQKEIESLKIVSMIIQQMPFEDILRLLEVLSLQNLLQRTLGHESTLSEDQQVVINWVMKVINMMENQNLMIWRSFLKTVGEFKEKDRKLKVLIERHNFELKEEICLK